MKGTGGRGYPLELVQRLLVVEVYPQQLVFRVLVVEARCTPWSWFEGYRVVVEVCPLELVGRVLVVVKVYHVGLVCVGVPSI